MRFRFYGTFHFEGFRVQGLGLGFIVLYRVYKV